MNTTRKSNKLLHFNRDGIHVSRLKVFRNLFNNKICRVNNKRKRKKEKERWRWWLGPYLKKEHIKHVDVAACITYYPRWSTLIGLVS